MITAIISGRVGKDAEIRDAAGQAVCSFSIASSTKVKGEDRTVWTDCTIWGTRGEKLAQYIRKGKFVVVSGTLTTREYNGKTYLQLGVNEIDLGPREDNRSEQSSNRRDDERAQSNKSNDAGDADDPLPF